LRQVISGPAPPEQNEAAVLHCHAVYLEKSPEHQRVKELFRCKTGQEGSDRNILHERRGQQFAQLDYSMRLHIHHVAEAEECIVPRRRSGIGPVDALGTGASRRPQIAIDVKTAPTYNVGVRRADNLRYRPEELMDFWRGVYRLAPLRYIGPVGDLVPPAGSRMTALTTACWLAGGGSAAAITVPGP
jgi:hypothetical protein